jgi:hypothetical protein
MSKEDLAFLLSLALAPPQSPCWLTNARPLPATQREDGLRQGKRKEVPLIVL